MAELTRYFSVRVSETAKQTLLDVLMHVGAKKLVNQEGAYIYEVEGEKNYLWVERCIRQIVGATNYRRYDRLPQEFFTCNIFDITL